ncbi:hypothetical protein [Streptomyces sp. NBC_00470]|uniref:hypothetical protein n=1 Tax=Streptomyces sp. NBC_00470 TaxID=2975753 RepID=UPI002F9083CD
MSISATAPAAASVTAAAPVAGVSPAAASTKRVRRVRPLTRSEADAVLGVFHARQVRDGGFHPANGRPLLAIEEPGNPAAATAGCGDCALAVVHVLTRTDPATGHQAVAGTRLKCRAATGSKRRRLGPDLTPATPICDRFRRTVFPIAAIGDALAGLLGAGWAVAPGPDGTTCGLSGPHATVFVLCADEDGDLALHFTPDPADSFPDEGGLGGGAVEYRRGVFFENVLPDEGTTALAARAADAVRSITGH